MAIAERKRKQREAEQEQTPVSDDPFSRLERLKHLKDKEFLTREEFESEKNALFREYPKLEYLIERASQNGPKTNREVK